MNKELFTQLMRLRDEVADRAAKLEAAKMSLDTARASLEGFIAEHEAEMDALRDTIKPKRQKRSDAGTTRQRKKAEAAAVEADKAA